MTDTRRALVVDDEPGVRRFLKTSLGLHGYSVSEASNAAEAIELASSATRFDVILLDLGLPDMDGVEVARVIREWSQVPIIVLSVRDQEKDKVAALDAGADDFLTKPFGLSELLARLRATLRRSQQLPDQPVIKSGPLSLDLVTRQVRLHDQIVSLTPTEYDILKALARHAGKVILHAQLIKEVWGHNQQDLHTLRVNVSNLRKKIEQDAARPQIVITEPGVGYRFHLE